MTSKKLFYYPYIRCPESINEDWDVMILHTFDVRKELKNTALLEGVYVTETDYTTHLHNPILKREEMVEPRVDGGIFVSFDGIRNGLSLDSMLGGFK